MQSIKLSRWFSGLALLVFALNWGEAALSAQQKRDGAPATQRQQDTTNQQQTNTMGQLPGLGIFAGKIVKSGEGKTVRATATVDARCTALSVLPGLSLNNNSWAPAATEVPTRCSLH